MFEQPGAGESMSPVPSGSASPNPHSCSNSPGGSPPVANGAYHCSSVRLQFKTRKDACSNGAIVDMEVFPSDFVTPLKKRRLARASMCVELPSFAALPGAPLVPESPLTIEHRSASVGGEPPSGAQPLQRGAGGEFIVPLLDAASLQPPVDAGKLPNGFRPPPHRHLSASSARSSTDSVFEVCESVHRVAKP